MRSNPSPRQARDGAAALRAGVKINDDTGLEKEADEMGARALSQRISAETHAIAQRFAIGQSVIQLMPMELNFDLAKEIAGLVGGTPDKVFNLFIANKEVWKFEENQKHELVNVVKEALQVKGDKEQKYNDEKDVADKVIEQYFKTSANKEAIEFIEMVKKSDSMKYAILYRGTNPKQALDMLREQTMGGAPKKENDDREAPTEEMQVKQTGFKIKKHLDSNGNISTLEEWSRNPEVSRGFATGGWLLVSLVVMEKTNYKESVEKGRMGEAGVVSWIETPALVAVIEKGRRL